MSDLFKCETDLEADDLITEIKEGKAEIDRYEKIAKEKVENIEMALELRLKNIMFNVRQNEGMLQAYFMTVKPKESKGKTQLSYGLLSGRLVMRNPTTTIIHDDKEIAKWCPQKYLKQIDILDWSRFKEDLEIKEDLLVNKYSGEVIEDLKGLGLQQIGERFEVKL
jgi:hypothetical protein